MTTADAQRTAHRRFVAHLYTCPKAKYQRFCQVCWDLEREASAEAFRRSEAMRVAR